ncbi:MAG TPA: cation:proton antiporter [Candidatus Limnocylindrales bacterium]|nr:cation:proton antiporter [Candidatus Limnocylindrales bacterium]
MEQAVPVLEIGLVLLVGGLAGIVARRFGLPAVVGYLAVGLIVGPFTPGYVADKHQIEVLADVGVVLLLFEVGIELDLRSLAKEPRGILLAVPLQVVLITALGAAAVVALGGPLLGGVTLGLVAALSSSVVVVNISRSRKRTTNAATERAMLVWAILQDAVTLVAATLLSVMLSPSGDPVIVALARAAVFVLLASVVQGWLVPRLLEGVKDQPDSFLILAVSAALATAGIGAVVFSVPVALAAFVAGVLFSIRPIAQAARREVLPFRDLFAVMFFVAIGTLVDPSAVAAEPGWLAIFLGLVLLKVLVVAALAAIFSVPSRKWQLGVGLGQIGEFSFVVLGLGVAAGVVSPGQSSAALAAAALTIAASAVVARAFPSAAPRGSRASAHG